MYHTVFSSVSLVKVPVRVVSERGEVCCEESPNDLFYSADGHGVLSSQTLPLLHQLIVQFARAEHNPGHIVPRHFVWYHSLETSTFTESHEYTTAQLGSIDIASTLPTHTQTHTSLTPVLLPHPLTPSHPHLPPCVQWETWHLHVSTNSWES